MEINTTELREKLREERYNQLRDLAKFFKENDVEHINEQDGDLYVETVLKIERMIKLINKCSDYSMFLIAMDYSDSDRIVKKIRNRTL